MKPRILSSRILELDDWRVVIEETGAGGVKITPVSALEDLSIEEAQALASALGMVSDEAAEAVERASRSKS